jgi:integrase
MKAKQPKEPEKPRRRQRGSGSIFQKLPCKKWVIQFYKNGRRVREATGFTDYDEAKKLLRQRLHEIDQGQYVARHGKPARVEDLHDILKAHIATNPKARKRDLPGRWAHLKPVFGALLASEVTTDDIRHYTATRLEKDKAAHATINRELGALKRMFRLAAQGTPPKVQRVPYIPMLREDNVRVGFVEDTGYARLVAEAGELWLRTFLELAFSYGWRRSELLGLRVAQVDIVARTIRLEPGSTKNRDGREVQMTSKVTELLTEAIRGKGKNDFVLTRKGNMAVKDFRTAWQNLCVRAELGAFICRCCKKPVLPSKKCACGSYKRHYEGLNPHDLRRSAAKALRSAGVPESVVMKIGGWKTAAMFRRYAIVSPADQLAAVKMLELARTERAEAEAKSLTPFTAPLSTQQHTTAKGVKPN